MKRPNLALAAALGALLGCSSDATGPNPLLGQVLFTYTGGIAGTFSVSAPPLTGGNGMASYVATQLDSADGMFYALGAASTGTSTRDLVMVMIPRTTVGNATITAGCTGLVCAGVMAIFGQSLGGIAQICTLTSGTVAITTLTSTRATGTFSGSGTCTASGGASTAFTITGGTFDGARVTDTPDT